MRKLLASAAVGMAIVICVMSPATAGPTGGSLLITLTDDPSDSTKCLTELKGTRIANQVIYLTHDGIDNVELSGVSEPDFSVSGASISRALWNRTTKPYAVTYGFVSILGTDDKPARVRVANRCTPPA